MEDATDATDATLVTPASTPAPPVWVGLVSWTALGLAILVALQIFGILSQGVALKGTGLTFSDRLGYSFLQTLDQGPLGLELLVAVLLSVLPAAARQRTTASQDRVAQIVIMASAAMAFLIVLGGVIAVPARTHILHLQKAKVNPVVKWFLFTFVIRNVGMALLALAAAVASIRVRFAPRRTVVDTPPVP